MMTTRLCAVVTLAFVVLTAQFNGCRSQGGGLDTSAGREDSNEVCTLKKREEGMKTGGACRNAFVTEGLQKTQQRNLCLDPTYANQNPTKCYCFDDAQCIEQGPETSIGAGQDLDKVCYDLTQGNTIEVALQLTGKMCPRACGVCKVPCTDADTGRLIPDKPGCETLDPNVACKVLLSFYECPNLCDACVSTSTTTATTRTTATGSSFTKTTSTKTTATTTTTATFTTTTTTIPYCDDMPDDKSGCTDEELRGCNDYPQTGDELTETKLFKSVDLNDPAKSDTTLFPRFISPSKTFYQTECPQLCDQCRRRCQSPNDDVDPMCKEATEDQCRSLPIYHNKCPFKCGWFAGICECDMTRRLCTAGDVDAKECNSWTMRATCQTDPNIMKKCPILCGACVRQCNEPDPKSCDASEQGQCETNPLIRTQCPVLCGLCLFGCYDTAGILSADDETCRPKFTTQCGLGEEVRGTNATDCSDRLVALKCPGMCSSQSCPANFQVQSNDPEGHIILELETRLEDFTPQEKLHLRTAVTDFLVSKTSGSFQVARDVDIIFMSVDNFKTGRVVTVSIELNPEALDATKSFEFLKTAYENSKIAEKLPNPSSSGSFPGNASLITIKPYAIDSDGKKITQATTVITQETTAMPQTTQKPCNDKGIPKGAPGAPATCEDGAVQGSCTKTTGKPSPATYMKTYCECTCRDMAAQIAAVGDYLTATREVTVATMTYNRTCGESSSQKLECPGLQQAKEAKELLVQEAKKAMTANPKLKPSKEQVQKFVDVQKKWKLDQETSYNTQCSGTAAGTATDAACSDLKIKVKAGKVAVAAGEDEAAKATSSSKDKKDNNLYIYIGAGAGGFVLIVIVAWAACCRKSKSGSADINFSNPLAEIPMNSLGPSNTPPKNPTAMPAAVNRNPAAATGGDTYDGDDDAGATYDDEEGGKPFV